MNSSLLCKRFLLAPYYQAELHLLIVDKERLDHLNSAKVRFTIFNNFKIIWFFFIIIKSFAVVLPTFFETL